MHIHPRRGGAHGAGEERPARASGDLAPVARGAAAQVARAQARVREGYYHTPESADRLARRLLEPGGVMAPR